jgi:hypothetical protein
MKEINFFTTLDFPKLRAYCKGDYHETTGKFGAEISTSESCSVSVYLLADLLSLIRSRVR